MVLYNTIRTTIGNYAKSVLSQDAPGLRLSAVCHFLLGLQIAREGSASTPAVHWPVAVGTIALNTYFGETFHQITN